MASLFPDFSTLTLSDHDTLARLADLYPHYSDFDFSSLWAWNIRDNIRWSILNGNLVVSLPHYTSGRPILTFLGHQDVDMTAEELVRYAEREGLPAELALVPEITAELLDRARFVVDPDRDNFDYVYDVAEHVGYRSPGLKTHRWQLRRFSRHHGGYDARSLDLGDQSVAAQLISLWDRWEDSAKSPLAGEREAFARFLAAANGFSYVSTGIYIAAEIAAFDVTVLDNQLRGNSLFAKADLHFRGINSVLQHEVSTRLLQAGCTRVNFEQDLGLEGLRAAKLSYRPVNFLRKFVVRPIGHQSAE